MTKPTAIEKLASAVGGAVRAFETARSGEGHGKARRPAFISNQAQEGRWKGGTYNPDKADAAARSLQNSWVYMMIQRKAMEKSAARLYVLDNPEGLDSTGTTVERHPFLSILRNPNPWMNYSFMSQYLDWWLDLLGECYIFLAPDEDGYLAELWPLPSNAVNPVPGDSKRYIDYYEYTANGVTFKIPAEYIYHEKYPNPFDVFRGLSPLVAAILPADADSAMAYWNGQFFGQDNVMPSAAIALSSGLPGQPIDPSDIQAVKDELTNEYAAISRKTLVTNAYDMVVSLLGWNARDMDFLAGRAFTKDEIILIFGGFPGMFDKSATEANSTTADNMFKEKTIWPALNQRAATMTNHIMRRFYGDTIEVRFEDIRPINRQLLIQQSDSSRDVLTVDERRERFWNAPPLPNNDGKKIASQSVPDPFGEIPTGGGQSTVLPNPQNSIVNAKALGNDLRAWRTRTLKSITDGRPLNADFRSDAIPAPMKALILDGLESAQFAEDVKAVFAEAHKGIIRSWRPWSAYEVRLTAEIEQILLDQQHELIERIRATGTADPLLDPVLWVNQETDMRVRIAPLLKELANHAARRVQQTVSNVGQSDASVNWDLANENAEAWARQHAGEMIRNVTQTTREAVGDLVAQWTQTGEGIDGLIARVSALTDEGGKPIFNSVRAEMIGITEATNVYAGANNQAWSAAGYKPAAKLPGAHVRCRCYLQPYKLQDNTRVLVWYTARDERVCKQTLETPWGRVSGCSDLHRTIVSEGPHMGEKV